jgi:cytochrome c biogenesis protein CcmG, thiol:disulfide interchange protein DsbE
MTKRRFIGFGLGILVLSLLWIVLTPVLFPPMQAQSESAAPHPGFLAPDFTLNTPDGEPLSLAVFRGQPVLVFLWASWCSVCKATMPGLQEVYSTYQPQGFEILAVNTTSQDSLPAAIDYFQSQGYSYPFLIDRDGSVSRDYQLRALPTAVLVSPDGTVEDVVIGSGLSQGYLRSKLDNLLNNQD